MDGVCKTRCSLLLHDFQLQPSASQDKKFIVRFLFHLAFFATIYKLSSRRVKHGLRRGRPPCFHVKRPPPPDALLDVDFTPLHHDQENRVGGGVGADLGLVNVGGFRTVYTASAPPHQTQVLKMIFATADAN